MIQVLLRLVGIFAAVCTVAGMVYYILCVCSAVEFLRHGRQAQRGEGRLEDTEARPVSILKPLKGVDPGLFNSLRSHCLQNYPQYEIIFGVSDADDPAVQLVKQLQEEFPGNAMELVVCPKRLGANTKVSNLVQMMGSAHYDRLVVNDSDIQVEGDYLRRVILPLSDPGVGMVTCLYRGVAGETLGSKLESVGISTDFAGGVLVARYLEGGVRFGLGSTLAFRRKELEAIGGFESIVDYLADDYELGKRIADLGSNIELSDVVVDTFLPAYDFMGFFEHQLRWARSVRDSRRWGYVGMLLTFALPWALVALVAAHGAGWAWGLLATAILLRLLAALVVGKLVLRDRQVLRFLPLVPLRDLLALLVWAGSFTSNAIFWRGDSFRLKDGKLIRISPGQVR